MFVARAPSEARIELVLPHVERRLCILASITRGWDARVGILGERCTARYTLRTYGDDREHAHTMGMEDTRGRRATHGFQ